MRVPLAEPTTSPVPSQIEPGAGPWRAFVQAHARLARRLDDELRQHHDLSLPEYDALLAIAEAPDRRIRMHLLADRVVLSKSGVTRLIDRLVADGFVERTTCSSDARGAEAVLTDAGLARLQAASATHRNGIEANFLSVAGGDELAVMERVLGEVAERLGPGGGCACEPAERRDGAERGPVQA